MTLTLLLALYSLTAAGLLAYGLNCHHLARVERRERHAARAARAATRARFSLADHELPRVTVQLPVFNERLVVQRLLAAVGALDYPADRLEIQALDDSTDETTPLAARACDTLRARGLDVQHLRRTQRIGFKAGALAEGTARCRGELIAIFDADFVPRPDFLRACLPHFSDPQVGLVQARWGHLDREHSWFTRMQALAVDGHFMIEQSARAWGGYLLNFNGTAGVWRRAAIDAAGGWTADTLTEDLDLSYRAQLAGWRAEYLPDVVAPAELPVELRAFLAQQRRWAQGSIETALKLGPRVWRAPLRPAAKLQALLHLTHYAVHPLMLVHSLLALPVLLTLPDDGARTPLLFFLVMLMAGTLGPALLYVQAQQAQGGPWRRRLRALPALLFVGCGLAVSNTRAVWHALRGKPAVFVRTPKRRTVDGDSASAGTHYAAPRDPLVAWQLAAGAWCLGGWCLALAQARWMVLPFLTLNAGGLLLVGLLSAREARQAARRSAATQRPPASDAREVVDSGQEAAA
ncbi:MAG: glucosyltransferase [Planctomycetota bacterium]|nr:MAG: glucosyltransferase [Planctomycetota bacterium]